MENIPQYLQKVKEIINLRKSDRKRDNKPIGNEDSEKPNPLTSNKWRTQGYRVEIFETRKGGWATKAILYNSTDWSQ